MTDTSRAVFLSYASQDAEAARRICEALRAAGMEVWFDQSELRGGDAWDQQIRKQIKTCALFIPIISANAHAREEGYFRLEWKLAVDRSHLMTDTKTFLLPVVIDDTSQSDERIPDRFRELQWSPLPHGATTPAFVERVSRLFSPELSAASGQAATTHRAPPSTFPGSKEQTGRPSAPWRSQTALLVTATVVVMAIGYTAVDKFWRSKHMAVGHQTAGSTGPALTASQSTIPDKSIAVLPFVDMSEKKDQEYFADGMAEEIIERLVKVPALRIPAQASSFYFKGKSTKLAEIARELSVANILEGSVRKSGNHIRIGAQLVRADNGYPIWSESYDRELEDVFKVQDEIANAVAAALQITLLGGPLSRDLGGTRNVEAYQLYLRAQSAIYDNTAASLRTAEEQLKQAVALDPSFGLAWSEMSWTLIVETDSGALSPKEGYERARYFANQALEVSSGLAGPHAELAYVSLNYDWNWTTADSEIHRAIDINPRDVKALDIAGISAAAQGHWDEALRLLHSALAQDPLNSVVSFDLAYALYFAGHYAEAEAKFRLLLETAPKFQWAKRCLAKAILIQDRSQEAMKVVQSMEMGPERLQLLPMILFASGHKTEAETELRQLVSQYSAKYAYSIAMNYAYENDVDDALQWLERAYAQKDAKLSQIMVEPLFKNILPDPRYKAFLRKMDLPE